MMVRDGAAPPPGAQDHGTLAARVFAQLSDGRFHSGAELARSLGVSRSAVWKATGALKELGATLHAVRNRGYRLASGGEALEAAKIREGLARDRSAVLVESVDQATSIPATCSRASRARRSRIFAASSASPPLARR